MDSQHDSALPWYDDRVKPVSGWTRDTRHNNVGTSCNTPKKIYRYPRLKRLAGSTQSSAGKDLFQRLLILI